MLKLAIVVIAIVGMLSNIPDPALRPYLDAATWLIAVLTMFALGDRLNGWIDRLAARPHWRRSPRVSRLQISNR